MGTTRAENPSNLMSHPKEEAGVEAEGGRGRGRGRGRGAAQGSGIPRSWAEDSLPSGETGNREAVQEEEDKSMTKALM